MEPIHNYVEAMFAALPPRADILQLKEEMLANLEEKFNALLASGKSEPEAVGLVIASIGPAYELRAGLGLPEVDAPVPEPDSHPAADPAAAAEYRAYIDRKHQLIAAAVALFILSPGVYQLFDEVYRQQYLGEVLMLVFVAAGTVLCIYANRRNGYYRELFGLGAEKCGEPSKGAGRFTRLFACIAFPAAAVAYLGMGFFGGLWHPGWIIFVACAALTGAVAAVEEFLRKS